MKKKTRFTIKLSDNTDQLPLHKGSLFWHSSTDNSTYYPGLTEDQSCDVCIIGAGMSGAMISHELIRHGLSVIVLDKAQPGHGSSDGNTGIIQYNSDRSLADFIKIEGEDKARDFYQLCHDAMLKLGDIVKDLGVDVGYKAMESVYITPNEKDEDMIREEVEALQAHKFPAKYLSEEDLINDCDLVGKHGILTRDDAMINPYKLIQALHQQNTKLGGKVYGNTFVTKVSRKKASEPIHVQTEDGPIISASQVIFCTGYLESFDSLKDRDLLHSTYSIVTKPVTTKLWRDNRMVWDALDPYLYFRVTEDNRIIAGGMDEETPKLSSDTIIYKKGEEMIAAIKQYYPQLKAEPQYIWQSVFGISKDEIPFIGEDPKRKDIYYALGFGGNGTCYSVAAADILSKLIQGHDHPYAYVVDPGRK